MDFHNALLLRRHAIVSLLKRFGLEVFFIDVELSEYILSKKV